ncbi:hypothetical protein DU30_13770 [Methanosarcina mazei]|uniref:Uncharacterized protein n=1 Tax=Methanosarcina mazei TaxID=2209 RepID=A0A0F8DR96_METMZ|nr:hypothetical protein DU30_13770 [Methanosarcina mazei]
MLIIPVSVVIAGETIIDKVAISPTQPYFGQEFTITAHINDPPTGGMWYCLVGDEPYPESNGVLDETGVFTVKNTFLM